MLPEKIVAIAKARGLDGIVICDHDTIRGGIEAQKSNKDPHFQVIVGAEIKTTAGDITGLFLKEEIVSREVNAVLDEIKAQGGRTLLNHPYQAHDLSKIDFDKIDFIEGFNARVSPEQNRKAVELAQRYGKPMLSGSDAHLYGEIGNAYTEVADLRDLVPVKHTTRYSSFYYVARSQYIKALKRKSMSVFLRTTKILIKRVVLSGGGTKLSTFFRNLVGKQISQNDG